MKSLFGACSVNRFFVNDFAKRARPLTDLTKNDIGPDLPQRADAQNAFFRVLKFFSANSPVLTVLHPSRLFIVDVDECADELGCALLQAQDLGELRPDLCYSRTLKPTKQNYCRTERRCLGAV